MKFHAIATDFLIVISLCTLHVHYTISYTTERQDHSRTLYDEGAPLSQERGVSRFLQGIIMKLEKKLLRIKFVPFFPFPKASLP